MRIMRIFKKWDQDPWEIGLAKQNGSHLGLLCLACQISDGIAKNIDFDFNKQRCTSMHLDTSRDAQMHRGHVTEDYNLHVLNFEIMWSFEKQKPGSNIKQHEDMQPKNGKSYDNQIATTSQRSFPFGVIVQASIVEKTQCLLPFCASFTCLSPEKISWVGLDDDRQTCHLWI